MMRVSHAEAEAEAPGEMRKAVRKSATEALAGGLSGVASRAMVAPFDVVKIKMQLDRGATVGMVGCARRIVREEGARGLWKGTVPSLVLWFVYSGAQFPAFSALKTGLEARGVPDEGPSSFAAAAGAALAATMVSYPLDTVRTRWVHMHRVEGSSLPRLVGEIARKDGIEGFYRGLVPALAQVVPCMALSFYFYDVLKVATLGYGIGMSSRRDKLEPAENLAIGAVAGLCAKVLVHPIDTVKKRLQVKGMANSTPYTGMIDCASRMAREEGMASLFRGAAPTLAKSALATGCTFASYELFLQHLRV